MSDAPGNTSEWLNVVPLLAIQQRAIRRIQNLSQKLDKQLRGLPRSQRERAANYEPTPGDRQ
jgi:hypothetical protein